MSDATFVRRLGYLARFRLSSDVPEGEVGGGEAAESFFAFGRPEGDLRFLTLQALRGFWSNLSDSGRGPRVSIIVRTKNRPHLIGRALRSVWEQDYPDIEVVIVNDGQDDIDAGEFGWGGAGRDLKIVQSNGGGRSVAANVGLQNASGDYIGFLDDDDWFYPNHVSTLVDALRSSKDRLAYSGVSCVTCEPSGVQNEFLVYNEPFSVAHLLAENFIPIHAALFSRTLLSDNVEFDTDLLFFEDWDFWLQLSFLTGFIHLDEVTAVYCISPEGSGLFGNESLQKEMFTRIYRKWMSRWPQNVVGEILGLARVGAAIQGRKGSRIQAVASSASSGHGHQGADPDGRRAGAQFLDARFRARHGRWPVATDAGEHPSGHQSRTGQDLLTAIHAASESASRAEAAQQEVVRLSNDLQWQRLLAADLERELAEVAIRHAKEASLARLAADKEIRKLGHELNELQAEMARATNAGNQLYEEAMDQLHRERLTVLRPIARRARALAKDVYHRLPGRARTLVRRFRASRFSLDYRHPLPASPHMSNQLVMDALSCRGDRFDVVVFPVIDWHFRTQRPQHFAGHLGAAGHRVFYFSVQFGTSVKDKFRIQESPAQNVFIVELQCPVPHPNVYESMLKGNALKFFLEAYREFCRTLKIGTAVTIIDLPFWRPLALALPGNFVVYDCMDYHAGFSTNKTDMLAEEEHLLEQADLVLTTSVRLYDYVGARVPEERHLLIRNAADVEFFSKEPSVLALNSDRP